MDMNNQAQLIDKEQILKWLEDEFRNYPAEHMGNYGAGQDMLDTVATKIESGAFDYTPPVPTIKPGDTIADLLFAYINKDADYPHDFEIEAFEDAIGYLRHEQYQSSKYNQDLFERHLKQMREVVE